MSKNGALSSVIICSVLLSVCCHHTNFGDDVTNGLHRVKRQEREKWIWKNTDEDERWTWGSYDSGGVVTEAETTTTTPIPTTTSTTEAIETYRFIDRNDRVAVDAERDRICGRSDPAQPDFSRPGRSISTTKCYEYIWQVRLREDRTKRDEECRYFMADYYNLYFAIGGRDAKPGEFPHMGGVGWKAVEGTWLFKCGATLISEKWALSAAHCAHSGGRDTRIADPVPKIIRFGDKNIIDRYSNGLLPLDRDIIKIIQHPKYRAPKKYYDISLMELNEKISFNYNVQPACLWSEFDVGRLGKEAFVTGWGVVESGSQEISPVLQVSVVDFIDSSTCDSLLRPMCNRHWCGINDTQICAGKLAGGVDACQGDSGGPLSVRIPLPVSAEGAMHHVVGITSFGFGCALKDTPGVYTRVSSFVPWIESIVWPS